ncbi:MAG: hypothetical protein ABI388_11600, partial [Bacteroidia bacterium]
GSTKSFFSNLELKFFSTSTTLSMAKKLIKYYTNILICSLKNRVGKNNFNLILKLFLIKQ